MNTAESEIFCELFLNYVEFQGILIKIILNLF